MKMMYRSLFILALLVCAVLVATETLPGVENRSNAFGSPLRNIENQPNTFDSPLPTPVTPGPTPMPAVSKETQQALKYIAKRDQVLIDQLAVVNQHRREYALLGQSFWSVTVLDIKNGQWYQVMVNLDDGSIVQDVEIIEQAEQEARRVKYGKLEPALFDRLETVKDDDLIEVAIWIAGDLKRSREDLYAELAEKYPESRKALEQSGNPFDVGDYKLINEVESAYVRLIEADVQERLSPFVHYLQDRGYVVTTLGALPSIAVTLPKKIILDLAEQVDIGMIYLNEGEVQRLMDSAAPSDRAPAVWQRGYKGNGVSIGILEPGKVDFDGPNGVDNWLHQGAVRACTEGVAVHKTYVASVAASYHSTYTGIAPDATIVDICTDYSRADTVAGLAWGVGYADVINVSLTFNNDPTLEWTDRAFDYWARTGNDTVVAGAGNVQDGYVGSPAKGWNVIAVGGSNDNNTSGWGDDSMWIGSSWHDPTGGDREKPEVIAPAQDIHTIGPDRSEYIVSGTSVAAPQVAGLAALLIDRNAELAANPPAVTAIIMASAVNNVDGPSGIPVGDDLKDGAGAIDASLADITAKTRCSSTIPSGPDPCWWGTGITSASFDAQGYLYRTFVASKGEGIRVAISWWSNADCASQNTCNYDRLDTDLNLAIKYLDPSDQQWKILSSCGSGSQDNNYELVEFVAPYTTQYAVAVYKQRMNESSNTLGIAWVKQGVYLPDIKSGYNGWESWITIRNDGARPKDVGIEFFNDNGIPVSGGLWYPSLPPGASYTFDSWVTDFSGSAIVNASEDVSVIVNNANTSTGHTYSYNGIAAADPLNPGWSQVGTDIHLPLLMDDNYGWSSSVTIFNAGSNWATISLDYYGQTSGGPYAGPQNVSLGPNASVTYDQSGSACPLVGAGRVRSSNGQPLAVTVRQVHSGGSILAYNGLSGGAATVAVPLIMIGAEGSGSSGPPSTGPYRVYMPLAMAGERGWKATLAVQNLGATQTNITVQYYPSTGYGVLSSQTIYNVQPHATAIFVPSSTGLWVGAAQITNSAGQPIAAVVNATNGGQAASYSGLLDGSSAIVLPSVRSDGGQTTGVQVQNLEASAADVVVKVSGGQVWNGTINAYSSVTIYPLTGSGSATVECTNGKRIAAIVNVTGSGPGDQAMSYSGVNR